MDDAREGEARQTSSLRLAAAMQSPRNQVRHLREAARRERWRERGRESERERAREGAVLPLWRVGWREQIINEEETERGCVKR